MLKWLHQHKFATTPFLAQWLFLTFPLIQTQSWLVNTSSLLWRTLTLDLLSLWLCPGPPGHIHRSQPQRSVLPCCLNSRSVRLTICGAAASTDGSKCVGQTQKETSASVPPKYSAGQFLDPKGQRHVLVELDEERASAVISMTAFHSGEMYCPLIGQDSCGHRNWCNVKAVVAGLETACCDKYLVSCVSNAAFQPNCLDCHSLSTHYGNSSMVISPQQGACW